MTITTAFKLGVGLAVLLPLPALAATPERTRWAGEARAVTITRDDWGIAHVRGHSDADAVFGMIYAQAEDDFNRIEINYLTALGRRAEAPGAEGGEAMVWQDLRQRLFVDPVDLQKQYAGSPAWLKALMSAWADGLNCYLATHPQVKPKVLTRFEPWMALAFSEGSIGGDIERASLARLEAFYGNRTVALTDDERGAVYREPKGSNGIAIAPANTVGGHALLLINPHTSFFFRAEQQVTSDAGLDVYGAATWGQFFIYQGWNRHAGWMHTSSGVDNVDEFAETIVKQGAGDHERLFYRYGKELRPVGVATVTTAVRGADGRLEERHFTTYRTHHGPIVREGDGAYGGKWIALALMNRPVEALQQSFLRTKAADFAAFRKIAELKANSSNDTVFADDHGTIAFLMPQFLPVRDDRFDYTRPVDGSDPATDWHGLHSLDQLPQVVNPKTGWIRNTNDWPWSVSGPDSPVATAYPRYLDQAGENPRGLHADLLLKGRHDFTLPGLIDAAYDSYLPAFAQLLPALFASYDALQATDPRRAALAAPVALLRGWDRRWGADSAATSLAVFWGEALWKATAGTIAKGLARYDAMAAPAAGDARLAALQTAVDRLTHDFGGWRVPWGQINRFQRIDDAIIQRFDDAKPSIPVPFASAQWGSLASFGIVRQPGTKLGYGTSGNSFVAAVEFGGPRVVARAVTAGGESGDPASPHFGDQATRYAGGQLRQVYFYPDELKGHVERTYHPGGRSAAATTAPPAPSPDPRRQEVAMSGDRLRS